MIQLNGHLCEIVQFPDLAHAKNIIIDCLSLQSINSIGIKVWVHWVSSLRQSKIFLENCPPCLMIQLNQVAGFFTSNMSVGSFWVPYISERTDETKSVLFRKGTEYSEDGKIIWPPVKDSLGNDMEVDVVESQYFSFLGKNR